MRSLDLVEQEHLGQLKNFWNKWSTLILIGGSALMLAFAGHRFWLQYQDETASKASALYELVEEKLRTQEMIEAESIVKRLRQDFQEARYTSMAVMLVAKAIYKADSNNAQNIAKAQDYFSWVTKHGPEDWIRDFSRIQQMHLLVGHQQFEKALSLGKSRETEASSPAILELMGDAWLAMDKRHEARQSYQQASDAHFQLQQHFQPNSPRVNNPLLEMKINALKQ